MFTCNARAVHVLCVRTGSNRFKSVCTRFPAKCVLNHISREMCPDACPYLLCTCCTSEPVQTGSNRFKPVQTGSNRFKPGKTQEKSAPSAVATGYINRPTTAIAITTDLRTLHSTSIQHHSHAATRRDAATVAIHQVLQVSIIYYLCLYEC